MAGLDGTITIHSGEYRPCLVNGKKALFHRWVEHESVILQSKCMVSFTKLSDIREVFERIKVVPNGFTAVKLGGTYALIEFENGGTSLIDPRYIKFLDTNNVFHENSIFFREEIKE